MKEIIPVGIAAIALYFFTRKPTGDAWKMPMSHSTDFWSSPGGQKGSQYKAMFDAIEAKYNLPMNILARIAWRESRFNHDVINGSIKGGVGEIGMFQLTPRWHPGVDYTNPAAAAEYVGKWLRSLYNNRGNWSEVLMDYNWGAGNVNKWIAAGRPSSMIPAVTKGYVKEVLDVEL